MTAAYSRAQIAESGLTFSRNAFGTIITYANGDPVAQEAMRRTLDGLCKGAIAPTPYAYTGLSKAQAYEKLYATVEAAFGRGRV